MALYPKQFIEITFLKQYKEIIYGHGFHYIGFALVCIGIEFLGKCLNSPSGWHAAGLSKKHFQNAISELMPKYRSHSGLLYEQLRSGFAHALLPGPKIGLTRRAESLQYGTKHLQMRGTAITLVIEDFYDDFEAACRELLSRTFPDRDKMNEPLLHVPSDTQK